MSHFKKTKSGKPLPSHCHYPEWKWRRIFSADCPLRRNRAEAKVEEMSSTFIWPQARTKFSPNFLNLNLSNKKEKERCGEKTVSKSESRDNVHAFDTSSVYVGTCRHCHHYTMPHLSWSFHFLPRSIGL